MAKNIRMVLLDVDGVLTDGSLWIGADGEALKRFHVRDGLAISLLKKSGIEVGFITGRTSKIVEKRADELGISLVFQGISDKLVIFEKILREYNLKSNQVAYMGDDLPDIPVLKKVGLSAAPASAALEVLRLVDFCAPYPGGGGAVRALGELILKAQDAWPHKGPFEK